MPKFHLLTPAQGNPKLRKGNSRGYQSYILHLSPADLSGHEVCKWRTKGCTALCLNLAGRGGVFKPGNDTNTIQEARKRRTRLFFDNQESFLFLLVEDIQHAIAYAASKQEIPVFRLNGTSDIVWENIPVTRTSVRYKNIFAAFPALQFYDYTKAPYNARRHDIRNYHLTFSYAETLANRREAELWYSSGHSVSVVFGVRGRKAPLPETFEGKPVFDADVTDLRFLDPHGVAGLRAKGNRWKHAPNDFINGG